MDFQMGDRVVTNEGATDFLRMEALVSEDLRGKSPFFGAGERAVVLGVDELDDLVYIRFDDGCEDDLYSWTLDLEYRPINDPKMYDKTLFD